MPLTVTVEQAAQTALGRWLAAGLPTYAAGPPETGVKVSHRWPDASKTLPPSAVTILRSGPPKEEPTQPVVEATEIIHDAVSSAIRPADVPADVATCIVALNLARASFEAHRIDTDAHDTADTTNAIAAPVATTQTAAEALANNFRTVLPAHAAAAAHLHPDAVNVLAGQAPVTRRGQKGPSVSSRRPFASCRIPRENLRIGWCRRRDIGEVEQPLQLDVWAQSDVARDDLMARLVPLLHAGPTATAGFTDDDPVSESIILPMLDGWTGFYCDAHFDSGAINDTPDAIRDCIIHHVAYLTKRRDCRSTNHEATYY